MNNVKVEYDFIGQDVVNGVLTEKVEHVVKIYPEDVFNEIIPLLSQSTQIINIKVEKEEVH